jgi:transmembrane sensor
MHITRKLIQDFFAGNCSEEEEYAVREWFVAHPEALKAYMTEESWDKFLPSSDSVDATPRMFRYINKKTQPRKTAWRWLAAASVIVAMGTGIYLAGSPEKTNVVAAKAVLPSRIIFKNELTKVKKLVLPDKSIAMVAPGSILKYDSGFVAGRNMELRGEASFSVVKDSTKPFCVHAKNINVTALGTIFSVTDYDSVLTAVHLFEGKVVIREEANASKKWKEVFLTAGQVFKFNNQDFSYAVSRIKNEAVKKDVAIAVKPVARPTTTLNFTNRNLAEVFAQLQKSYRVKIQYKEDAIKDMRFTGTHNPATETLEDFLNTIAILNDLKVKKITSGFLITPNQ